MREASLVEIRNFFGMSSTEISKEWRVLNDDEKLFFKVEVAKALDLS